MQNAIPIIIGSKVKVKMQVNPINPCLQQASPQSPIPIAIGT